MVTAAFDEVGSNCVVPEGEVVPSRDRVGRSLLQWGVKMCKITMTA